MSDKIMSYLVQRTCGNNYTVKDIHDGKCDLWNSSQRGCSKCPKLEERHLYGYKAVKETKKRIN